MSVKSKKRKHKRKLVLKKSVVCALLVIVLVMGLIISMTSKKGIIYSGIKKALNGLGVYTEEVREESITSPNYSNPGSFKIDKSFEWVDYKKIKVTYDLTSKIETNGRNKDVIIVLDVSRSMEGDRLTKAKNTIYELIDYLLESNNDQENRMALITFESTSTIVSDFTDDGSELRYDIANITSIGGTNYYAALSNVYDLMSSYEQSNDTDVVTVFITDGYPNEDTPTQNVMYQALKQKYPYMDINGIEFEMGNNIIQEVDDITDNVWITNKDNLQNALFEAALSPDVYDNFTINNYISNYFNVTSNDITTDRGEATLTGNKISWNLGENLRVGSKVKMEVVLTIKDEYMQNQNYFPLSSKDEINYSLNNNSNSINHTDTLVTKNIYDVKYDVNTPDGCSLSNISDSTSAAFTNVTKNQNDLYCGGYLFKGFEIRDLDSTDVQYMNDDVFVMPGHDVEIKGVWSKQSVYKSMDGTVKEAATLYNVLKEQEGTFTKKYEGAHHDSFDREPTKNIYHYYTPSVNGSTIANNMLNTNNVVFGGYCWQMIRTTDTGGVKMIYNGPPGETIVDGKTQYSCLSSRATSGYEGFNGYSSINLGTSTYYYYGKDYTYDRSTKKFTLIDYRSGMSWNNNKADILSTYRYRCNSINTNVCSEIYYVESESSNSSSYANVIKINSESHYSQYGNIQYNYYAKSLASVGYMYNKSYDTSLRSLMDNGFLFSKTMGTSTSYNYYYSSSINYNSSTEKYELESDAEQISWATYKTTSLDGQKRYTCLTTSSLECKEVYYVLDVTTESNTLFARIISGGDLPSNPDGTITFSKDISSSPDIDGKYSLEGSTRIDLTRMEWYSNYNTYFYGIVYNDYPKKYYYCSDYSDKCAMENMRYLINPRKTISSPTMGVIYLKPVDIIKFGSSFKYENDEYTLDGTTYDIWNYDNSNERNKIANAHYTCFNASGMCQEISYVYYYQNTNGLNYINLSNGANIGQIINETLYYDNGDETVNKYDSTIKQGVDMWFKKYLRNYSEYLEETVFCNDRTINVFAGWDPNGGNIKPGTLYFRYNSAGFKPDVDLLDCTNITDQFSTSVNDTKAKLTYSVGLLTTAERRLLQNSTFTETPKQYWLMTPNNISIYISMNTLGASSYTSNGTNSLYGVRPVISLAPGIEYSEGNGSQATPYIIDVE